MRDTRKLLVIGGGIAGATAALAARAEYPDARIALYSSEPHVFYNKIALDSVVTGKRSERDLSILAPNWLEDHGIDCHWGEPVRAIEPAEHRVMLEAGKTLTFDKLILATGARPILPPVPGIDSPFVYPLWSLDHALRLRERVRGASRLTVLGGGVLGVEAALDLAALGLEVTLVEARPRLMPDLLDEEAAILLARAVSARGVVVKTNTPAVAVVPHDAGCRVTLQTDEGIDADLAILVTGVASDTALAAAAGLRIRRGIVVDEHLITSDPDILAAGNCVDLGEGSGFLWNPARRQGEIAGLNAFAVKRSYRPLPLTLHAKTPGLPLFVCGRAAVDEPGDRVVRDRGENEYRLLRFDSGGRLAGVILLGDVRGYYALERAVRDGVVLPQGVREKREVEAVVSELVPPRESEEFLKPSWVCRMCGYNVEGEHPPGICPVCGVGRDQFLAA